MCRTQRYGGDGRKGCGCQRPLGQGGGNWRAACRLYAPHLHGPPRHGQRHAGIKHGSQSRAGGCYVLVGAAHSVSWLLGGWRSTQRAFRGGQTSLQELSSVLLGTTCPARTWREHLPCPALCGYPPGGGAGVLRQGAGGGWQTGAEARAGRSWGLARNASVPGGLPSGGHAAAARAGALGGPHGSVGGRAPALH